MGQLSLPLTTAPRASTAPRSACPNRRGGTPRIGLSSRTNYDAPNKSDTQAKSHLFVFHADSEYAEIRPIAARHNITRRVGDGSAIGESPDGDEPERKRCTRGDRRAIEAFTRKSQLALRRQFNKLDVAVRRYALFVTLTYAENMLDGRRSKKHLEAFDKAVERAYPDAGYIWKMEQQKRGSIHYHLLIFGARFIPHEWLAETWARIVAEGGDIDPVQLDAGTSIERATHEKASRVYLEKYIAKVLDLNENNGIEQPGRFWGVRRIESFQGEKIEVECTEKQAITMARTLDKLKKSQIERAWRERGVWNRSVGRSVERVREMLAQGWKMSVSLSVLLHNMQRKHDPEKVHCGGFSDLGYEHCKMHHWARHRKKQVGRQRSIWQVAVSAKTVAQLLCVAFS